MCACVHVCVCMCTCVCVYGVRACMRACVNVGNIVILLPSLDLHEIVHDSLPTKGVYAVYLL